MKNKIKIIFPPQHYLQMAFDFFSLHGFLGKSH